jgi:hypothetical protein
LWLIAVAIKQASLTLLGLVAVSRLEPSAAVAMRRKKIESSLVIILLASLPESVNLGTRMMRLDGKE